MNKVSKKILIGVSVVILAYGFYRFFYDGTKPIKSTFNGKEYQVAPGQDSQVKSNLLAVLHMKLETIVDSLRNNSNVNCRRLISNWDKGVTIKEVGNMESDAAYVINKKHMSICLKDFKKNITPESINLLTYVGIHELAHIMSQEIGHESEFKNNFKFLLDHSKKISFRDPFTGQNGQLYISLKDLNTPGNYCGVSVINSMN